MHNGNQVDSRIDQWRHTIINKLILFLAVVNAIGTVLQYFSLTYTPAIYEHVIVWGLTCILIIVAITKRIPSTVKALVVMILIYTGIIKQFLTHGIISSSPVYLMAAPVIAFFIIGKKAAWISFWTSIMIFACFTLLIYFNVFPVFSYTPVDPLNPGVWIEIGISIAVAMIVILLVAINYHRFVTGTIQQALVQSEENALLEKEVHHRVKNNLALMKSLMQMQANISGNDEFRWMSQTLQGRIQSLSLIHEMLYDIKEKRKIGLASYVQKLGTNLLSLHRVKNQVNISYDIDEVDLHIDQATPLGLILNEVLTNSLQHAFPESKKGGIWIIINVSPGDVVQIEIRDNGPGIPDIDKQQHHTLGMQLIEALASQLRAQVHFENNNGATCKIEFEKDQHV